MKTPRCLPSPRLLAAFLIVSGASICPLAAQSAPASETTARATPPPEPRGVELLTAGNLARWQTIAREPAVDAETGSVTLRAGAQLYRQVAEESLNLRLVSRPVFGSRPADWATLELGPVSLTFVRDPDGGGMVLLADEPLALPFALPLDAEGRSREPLEFTLSFDQARNLTVLLVAGVDFELEATAPPGPIEVALSAGQSADWTLDLLELTVGEAEEATADDQDKGTGRPIRALREPTGPAPKILAQELGPKAKARAEANDRARELFAGDEDEAAEKVLTDSNRNPKGTPEWYLETANALVQTAFTFTREGRPQKAVQLAQRALEHTDKAARKAARLSDQEGLMAAADETAAFIQERLLADYDAAKAFYQRAALHYPSGKSNPNLRRLERIGKMGEREARATAR